MRRSVAALALVVVSAGCVTSGERSRTFLPESLGSGWVASAPLPELRQAGPNDCGAASLAMMAGRWHVDLSVERALAALPAPAPEGIRLGDLRDAARASGLAAFAIAGDRDTLVHELRAGRPVLVGLLLPRGGGKTQSHYEVIVAVNPAEERFLALDPARGRRVLRFEELEGGWQPAGRPTLVVVGPVVPGQVVNPLRRARTAPGGTERSPR